MSDFKLYNTLSRSLEVFEPINAPNVGIYVCGPTVYGPPHMGHIRGPVTFDVLRRFLIHKGFKVRFVRNITDVGHIVGDADEGEDKLIKQARLDQVEPMQVAQTYTVAYNEALRILNILPPDIEPRASGHIPEQIEMIQEIINNGLAYESEGNVYFDVMKYAAGNDYGKLSGRIVEDLIAGAGNESRELEGQETKRNPNDFALWKNAAPEHIMKWNSPWGQGYPGWHIECSAMSAKYLGNTFDIHGGGMDLLFPHHECEIAQSTSANQCKPVKYWIHHNMITINGQKMAKSLNNGIKVTEFFDGSHPLLDKAYSPMTLRFSILQAHYRGTLDFSNKALSDAEKGLKRLFNAYDTLDKIKPGTTSDFDLAAAKNNMEEALHNDMATPQVIAEFFELATQINNAAEQRISFTANDIETAKQIFDTYLFGILGIVKENESGDHSMLDGVMQLVLDIRSKVKAEKNYALSDEIRNQLTALGIEIKDGKEGSSWSKN